LHFATTKGNPSLIDWTFPGTLQDVWATLSSTRQHEIALDCASTAERRNIPVTTRLLANALNCRAQAISALGPQELAKHVVTFAQAEPDALDEIFRVYFSFRHKRMVARFLEHLQIRTDGASDRSPSKQAKAELENAIAELLREFRHDDVMLYTQVLSCQNPTFWSELSRVNFKTIDVAVRNTEPAEPYVPKASTRISRAVVTPVADPSGDEAMRTGQELQSDLKELIERFSRTADELQATVADLRAGKLPPAVDENLARLGPAFAKLVYDVCARASQLGIDRTGEAFRSIDDLTPAIAAIEEKEKANADAERVTRMLGQVQELSTLNGREFQPLDALKESARALQQELSAAGSNPLDPASSERLRAFELVLKMVDASTPGDDENAEEVVAEQFGAKLLYALGTGKIVRSIPSETQPAAATADAPSLSGMEMLLEASSKLDAYSETAAVNVGQTDVA
jgi:hypothetical protein